MSLSKTARVGLVGVGLMGHGIAANVLKAGYPLVFLDHPGNRSVDDLRAGGAEPRVTGAAVAQTSDVIILCVTGTPQVEDVLFREDGILAGMKPGTIIVDCSTAIASSTREIAGRVAAAGGRFMDAAMTRTPKEAEEGRLNLIVGAPEDLFAEVLPLLQSYAENIVHAGPVGAGHELKLLHNFVSLGFSAVFAEAAAAARKAGVADGPFLEVLGKGGAAGVVFDRLRPFMETGDIEGFRFSLSNGLKDLSYYNTMVEELGAQHAMATAARAMYAQVVEAGHGNDPVPELISILAADS
ncbi:NAD(P)-dependent oxidoreductase [Microbaculum sp. FT89]|uniref:NAD(P)-dependent oxidoreductase n=1 Tax=Microbaculum sp. FT89 TaxID=3447298 RepID=UPI003F53D074